MGTKAAIAGTAVLIVAFMAFMYVMLPYFTPEDELPICEIDMVYFERATIEQYGIDESLSMDKCDCLDDSEWVKEASEGGWICIPMDPTRPDCTAWPYLSTTDCTCSPPNVWYSGEGVNWKCDEP